MVNMENYEEFMMLYADKELSDAEEKALLAFVAQHSELEAELKAYMATKLQVDKTLVYPDKETLVRNESTTKIALLGNWKTYAAAAGVILFITLFVINMDNKNEMPITPQVAQNDQQEEPATREPEEQPIVQVEKKLHSKQPVKTIAMETKKHEEQITDVNTSANKVHQHNKEEKVVPLATSVASATKFDQGIEILRMEAVEIPEIYTAPVIETVEVEQKGAVAISTPFSKRPEGLDQLAEVLNEKILMAKTIKDEIKDTKINLQIGKKEILIVRL